IQLAKTPPEREAQKRKNPPTKIGGFVSSLTRLWRVFLSVIHWKRPGILISFELLFGAEWRFR
ncbi:hypothetical protein, partial [Rhizobium skierniewicense]|uniref:hypothetical protein n=1 Tax=Rhizobium skierniewicense TaxID=984260 RepID=UPI001AEE6736